MSYALHSNKTGDVIILLTNAEFLHLLLDEKS